MSEVMLEENENMTIAWRRDVDMCALEGVGVTEKVFVYDKNGGDASASLQYFYFYNYCPTPVRPQKVKQSCK